MEPIDYLTSNSNQPRSLIEFLLGDETHPGWLDRALTAANPKCRMEPSPVPLALTDCAPDLRGTKQQIGILSQCSETVRRRSLHGRAD